MMNVLVDQDHQDQFENPMLTHLNNRTDGQQLSCTVGNLGIMNRLRTKEKLTHLVLASVVIVFKLSLSYWSAMENQWSGYD